MSSKATGVTVGIACGGTGGHLFPGLAVASEVAAKGARVVLFVSPKEVDQQGVAGVRDRYAVEVLPSVAFSARRLPSFAMGVIGGYRRVVRAFASTRPSVVLAMGGFTALPPVLAAKRLGARVVLHESNAIPGRANRWLAPLSDLACAGMTETALRWRARRVCVTGTPVRAEVRSAECLAARRTLGLAEDRPVLLVTGGSQGASGVNRLFLASLPDLARLHPELQFLHLTGDHGFNEVSETYRRLGIPARIWPFSPRMDQLLAASTVVVSRSGASSLSELAARRLPSVLIPYPTAADDHQRANAAVFVDAGAARSLDQVSAGGADLTAQLCELLESESRRSEMAAALARLDRPQAASEIARLMWELIPDATRVGQVDRLSSSRANPIGAHTS
jgi:UDP-N-acetylglucosamine--N-acetylmuramyl-(pentapeptide) pyrophosphoryl-undecaprenol N-acetylglucosamine transferase